MRGLSRIVKRTQIKNRNQSGKKRWGAIVLLASGMMVMVFGFLAFTVDVGYIALTKAQLEAANDAGVRAAVYELRDGLGFGATKTDSEAKASAMQAATTVAGANRAGDQSSIYVNSTRDVRVGNVVFDPTTGTWAKQWNVAPYNMVELSLHRDQLPAGNTETGEGNPVTPNGDAPLPLFFAPVIGHDDAPLLTKAVSALLPGKGFRVPTGSGKRADILPFALDLDTWNDLINNNTGDDNYTCNVQTETVSAGGDGISEVNLYPDGDKNLPPGNRGTVDLGAGNNSSSDIARQILYGLNAYDLSFFPNNEISASSSNPLMLNGDTGISAGFKDELEAIKGESRAIPIFTHVSGNGNNAMYTVVKFVGIRIVDVKLTGNPKHLIVQPSPYIGDCVTYDTSGAPIHEDTIFTTPVLIE